jgi:hypothetical protein
VFAQKFREARILHHRENLPQQMPGQSPRARLTDLAAGDPVDVLIPLPAVRAGADKFEFVAAALGSLADPPARAVFPPRVLFAHRRNPFRSFQI